MHALNHFALHLSVIVGGGPTESRERMVEGENFLHSFYLECQEKPLSEHIIILYFTGGSHVILYLLGQIKDDLELQTRRCHAPDCNPTSICSALGKLCWSLLNELIASVCRNLHIVSG